MMQGPRHAIGENLGVRVLILFFFMLPVHCAVQAAAPPNILWIVAEDMSPDMACYGDAYAHTPHLDALAAQGARFTRAFSISGVCAPSRSALITGIIGLGDAAISFEFQRGRFLAQGLQQLCGQPGR